MKRRTLIKGLLAGGLWGVAYQAVEAIEGEFSWGKGEHLVSRSRTAMGTLVSVTIIDRSRNLAEEAILQAFETMDSLVATLSRHQKKSPIFTLNTTGYLRNPPQPVVEVLSLASHHWKITGGAFDISVKPLLDLYQNRFSQGQRPDVKEIKEALETVGFEKVAFSSRGIFFKRQGMGITLDGLAKGYIVDAMVDELRKMGVNHGLVNAGGDLRAFGGRGPNRPWRIAVRDPKQKSGILKRFELFDGACATSGDYEIYFDRERLFYHIVDPQSGLSPKGLSSATVLARSAAQADALSTALMVLGPSGRGMLSSLGFRAYIVPKV